MSRLILVLVGFLFVAAGVLTGVYVMVNHAEEKTVENNAYPFEERLKIAEELLNQSSKKSNQKALLLFTELSSKSIPEKFQFRVRFGHAGALQKNKDRLRALDIYKELNQMSNLTKEERESLSYALGNVLLLLNQEEEGKIHLNSVLQTSKDSQLRSKALLSIADFYMRKGRYENASKNYFLAVQEYPNNVQARIGWTRALRKLGRDFASYDIFENYSEEIANIDKEEVKTPPPAEDKQTSFDRAKTLYNKAQYDKAIKAFTRLLRITPAGKQKEKILYYIGESNLKLGRYPEAIKYAEEVLVNEPSSLDHYALYTKGMALFSSKKYDRAAAAFNAIVDKYEPSPLTERAKKYSKECLQLLKEEANAPAKEEKKPADANEEPNVEEMDADDDTP
ncbi:MAG TPA: tetratricopeptide repeat protein [Leptospiraceae bacterium]|nr:tetratricopeptide repeat protein [Leptospiraceae bacterium]HMW05836.1 tetratricopeptide repeat protein [Leptospiraceae bacterium]HMX33574.1 tetratricopeptide repeat protein [Leptospiraceae bacterium]HMY34372.1 tetratricopeptide repeat protein [Leptospiraceae bacterium]HMZ64128.1 tetratricopeptide repeat protein [Leptospiraceae bacterium]